MAKVLGPMLRLPGALREGSVYVIGLGRFREKLAANWARYQTRIYEAIDHTIGEHVSPRDVYMRVGDETYVLSFDSTDMAQSAIKAALIARKIKEKLFGQSDIEPELHLLGEDAIKAARERAAASSQAKDGRSGSSAKADDRDFMFMPMWDALNKVLSTYVCLPTLRQRSGRIQVGGEQLAHDASEIEWAEFNAQTVDYATDIVDELYRNQFAVFIAVQCNYKSLESARSREIFLGACRKIPEHLRKFMMVQIAAADPNIPTSTLTERINALKPYFRAVGMQLMSLDQPVGRLAFTGLNSVGYAMDASSPPELKKFANLVRDARNARLLVGIGKIPDIVTADRLATLGVAYLSGPFLGEALEMPANMMRCSLEELGRKQIS